MLSMLYMRVSGTSRSEVSARALESGFTKRKGRNGDSVLSPTVRRFVFACHLTGKSVMLHTEYFQGDEPVHFPRDRT